METIKLLNKQTILLLKCLTKCTNLTTIIIWICILLAASSLGRRCQEIITLVETFHVNFYNFLVVGFTAHS